MLHFTCENRVKTLLKYSMFCSKFCSRDNVIERGQISVMKLGFANCMILVTMQFSVICQNVGKLEMVLRFCMYMLCVAYG